jgi:TRAP-type uncharacterized transport system substrate-binding protein
MLHKLSGALLGAMLLSSTSALAQVAGPGTITICSGSAGANYDFAANEIGSRLQPIFGKVILKNTEGSLDNLRKLLNGECDMAFAQSDVADLYRIENPSSATVIVPFKNIYTEYVQVLCPVRTKWMSLSDLSNARKKGVPVKLIVGKDGSGTAETWRSIRQIDPETLDKIERLPEKPDPIAVSTVKDSDNTCMFWVSGLNSGDLALANETSIKTRDRKPSLNIISFEKSSLDVLKDSNGAPIYAFDTIEAKLPVEGRPGLYNNLISDRGYWSSNFKIEVPTVEAKLMTTKAFKDSIKEKAARMVTAIEDASPTIWNKVNPGNGLP